MLAISTPAEAAASGTNTQQRSGYGKDSLLEQDRASCKNDRASSTEDWKTICSTLRMLADISSPASPQLDIIVTAWAITLRAFTGNDTLILYKTESQTSSRRLVLTIDAASTLDSLVQRTSAALDSKTVPLARDDHIEPCHDHHSSSSGVLITIQRNSENSLSSLSLHLAEDANTWNLTFRYLNTEVSHDVAESMTRTLQNVFESILAFPDQYLRDTELIHERQQAQIVSHNKAEIMPAKLCAHELIALNATSMPEAMAVHSTDISVTYLELLHLSIKVAGHLRLHGVQNEVPVAVYMEKSPWVITALLAIMWAGGSFVLIDVSHPITRVKQMLQSLDVRLVIVSGASCDTAELSQETLDVDIMSKDTAGDINLDSVTLGPTLDSLAYFMFTSGTTRAPKAIAVDHRALSTGMSYQGAALGLGPSTRTLQFSSFAFDAYVAEILSTLVHGGCVCIPNEQQSLEVLSQVIRQMEINFALLTPTVLRMLRPEDVPGLETLASGGEVMTQDIINTWARKTKLFNVYGPAECTVISAARRVDPTQASVSLIGNGVGCILWLVSQDNHDILMPSGAIGELLVEGPIVARSYVGNIAATQTSFDIHPRWHKSNGTAQSRIYKTGDLCRRAPDDILECLGRKDPQIKLRGQRIEPGEIEAHIRRLVPNALEVIVDVVKQRSGNTTLTAFWKLERTPEQALLDDDLTHQVRLALAHHLPRYMVPSLFITIDKTPLTIGGKIDRSLLHSLAFARTTASMESYKSANASSCPGPTTDTFSVLKHLWSQTLQVENASVTSDSDFFEMGGDSLKAMRLGSRAREAGIHLTTHHILRYPSFGVVVQKALQSSPLALLKTDTDLNSGVTHDQQRKTLADVLELPIEDIEDFYACTFQQQKWTNLSLELPGTYIGRYRFTLPSIIDLDKFRAAWDEVVLLFPTMRTRFVSTGTDQLTQVVLRSSPRWHEVETLDQYRQLSSAWSMNLGSSMAEFTMIQGHNDPSSIVITMHHAVYDSWSMILFGRHVMDRYRGISTVPVGPSLKDFVLRTRDTDDERASVFWREQLANARVPTFPFIPRSDITWGERKTVTARVSTFTSKVPQITLATTLRATWALVLAAFEGACDIMFTTATTGRNSDMVNVDCMPGPAAVDVPIRMRIDLDKTVHEFLNDVQRQSLDMMPFEHYGFDRIIRESTVPGEKAYEERVIIVTQPVSPSDYFDSLEFVPLPYGPLTSAIPVTIFCYTGGSEVAVQVTTNPNILSVRETRKLVQVFETAWNALSNMNEKTTCGNIFHKLAPAPLPTIPPEEIETLLKQVGRLALDTFTKPSRPTLVRKPIRDFVSKIDKQVQTVLFSGLRNILPDYLLIGEEPTETYNPPNIPHPLQPDHRIILVDPIDGSSNYGRGIDDWAISLAILHGNRSLFGAIYFPQHGTESELYSGGPHEELTLNGHGFTPMIPPKAAQVLAGVGFGENLSILRRIIFFATMLGVNIKIRRISSLAASFREILRGNTDAYLSLKEKAWGLIPIIALINAVPELDHTLDLRTVDLNNDLSVAIGTTDFIRHQLLKQSLLGAILSPSPSAIFTMLRLGARYLLITIPCYILTLYVPAQGTVSSVYFVLVITLWILNKSKEREEEKAPSGLFQSLRESNSTLPMVHL